MAQKLLIKFHIHNYCGQRTVSSTAVTVDNVQNGTIAVGQIVRGTGITGIVKIATVNSQTSAVLDTAVTVR